MYIGRANIHEKGRRFMSRMLDTREANVNQKGRMYTWEGVCIFEMPYTRKGVHEKGQRA
jgi:hypothetical protein